MWFQFLCPPMIAGDVVEVYFTLFQCLLEFDFAPRLSGTVRAVRAMKEKRYHFFVIHVDTSQDLKDPSIFNSKKLR